MRTRQAVRAALVGAAVLAATLGGRPTRAQTALPSAPFVIAGNPVQGALILATAPRGAIGVALDGKPIPIAPDGRFPIGLDRDAGASAVLSATFADGRTVEQRIAVAPRAWRIERLDRLPKYPVPSAEFQRRRPAELAQIKAARAIEGMDDGWRQPFQWPVTGRISGLFGAQRIYRGEPGAYHSGTDIARPTGTIVHAPAAGTVILAADAPFTLEGHLLMIDHGQGLNSAFLHLSRFDVKVGDHVRQGQPIGAIGMSGRATGPHLHWSVTWRGSRLDPMLLAGPMTR